MLKKEFQKLEWGRPGKCVGVVEGGEAVNWTTLSIRGVILGNVRLYTLVLLAHMSVTEKCQSHGIIDALVAVEHERHSPVTKCVCDKPSEDTNLTLLYTDLSSAAEFCCARLNVMTYGTLEHVLMAEKQN